MTTKKIPGKTDPVSTNQLIDGTENFTWGEATKGLTRIPTSWRVTQNIIRVAQKLQKLRDNEFNCNPVIVTSWFRDPVSNQKAGGVSNSKHLEGHAVDFYVSGMNIREVQRLLQDWEGGFGSYSTFVHLDLGSRRRW